MALRQETPLAGLPHSFFAADTLAAPLLLTAAGAYVLVIATVQTVPLPVAGKTAQLSPGTYLYCGSAKGPGGLRARVERHLRAEKTQRWHVDRLTALGNVKGVVVVPDGDECDLFQRFCAAPGCSVPVAGFGSSDCRRCPAHLLRIDGGEAAIGPILPEAQETFANAEAARLGLDAREAVERRGAGN